MLEEGKSGSCSPPEKEAVAEEMCEELTATPIPHPPALLQREEIKKL